MRHKLFGMMLFAMVFSFSVTANAQREPGDREPRERPERAEKADKPERAEKADRPSKDDCRDAHERKEHNIVERAIEKVWRDYEKVHREVETRRCQEDKVRPDPKPSRDPSDRKFDKY